jgi:hypothetical protein
MYRVSTKELLPRTYLKHIPSYLFVKITCNFGYIFLIVHFDNCSNILLASCGYYPPSKM